MLEISLAAEKIAQIGGFPVTNSMLMSWVTLALLTIFTIAATRKMSLIPNSVQSIAELIIESLQSFFSSILGHHLNMVFPFIATLFLFIITSNWAGLIPGVGTIGFFHTKAETVIEEGTTVPVEEAIHSEESAATQKEEQISEKNIEKEEPKFTPLLRGATADLNTTIALAVLAVLSMQYFGFKTLGFKYGSRFFSLKSPIDFFVGILEIISDTSKVISFAFRLFGNIFAGEVLLSVMAFLMPFLAPLPFLGLELFVGFIQALVFATLTSVFINVAVSHSEE